MKKQICNFVLSIVLVVSVCLCATSVFNKLEKSQATIVEAKTIPGRFMMADNYGNKMATIEYAFDGIQYQSNLELSKHANIGDSFTIYRLGTLCPLTTGEMSVVVFVVVATVGALLYNVAKSAHKVYLNIIDRTNTCTNGG